MPIPFPAVIPACRRKRRTYRQGSNVVSPQRFEVALPDARTEMVQHWFLLFGPNQRFERAVHEPAASVPLSG